MDDKQHALGEHTFEDRREALEEAFFARRNRELIEQHRAAKAAQEEQEALAGATGIRNDALLERLMQLGVTADTLVALSLIPLVTVAWADEKLEEEESQALLKAAADAGIEEDSGAAKLLQEWMAHKPGPELVATWRDYVGSLVKTLDKAEVEELKREVLQRAQDVAFAAGGFLGIGAVSWMEKRKLEELATAFDS